MTSKAGRWPHWCPANKAARDDVEGCAWRVLKSNPLCQPEAPERACAGGELVDLRPQVLQHRNLRLKSGVLVVRFANEQI